MREYEYLPRAELIKEIEDLNEGFNKKVGYEVKKKTQKLNKELRDLLIEIEESRKKDTLVQCRDLLQRAECLADDYRKNNNKFFRFSFQAIADTTSVKPLGWNIQYHYQELKKALDAKIVIKGDE